MDWTWREDRCRAPGIHTSMQLDAIGPHVRYALLLRRLPLPPSADQPRALIVRCYDSGLITLAEDAWED